MKNSETPKIKTCLDFLEYCSQLHEALDDEKASDLAVASANTDDKTELVAIEMAYAAEYRKAVKKAEAEYEVSSTDVHEYLCQVVPAIMVDVRSLETMMHTPAEMRMDVLVKLNLSGEEPF